MYYVYVIQSVKDRETYIGYTENLKKRIAEHNTGKTKSIVHRIPFQLVYYEAYQKKHLAQIREISLKKNSNEKAKLFLRIFQNNGPIV